MSWKLGNFDPISAGACLDLDGHSSGNFNGVFNLARVALSTYSRRCTRAWCRIMISEDSCSSAV
jgi:hypothetical protein